jgi:hypothetical protein
MKSGNLNFLEPSRPLQACDGTALPLPIYIYIYVCVCVYIYIYIYIGVIQVPHLDATYLVLELCVCHFCGNLCWQLSVELRLRADMARTS